MRKLLHNIDTISEWILKLWEPALLNLFSLVRRLSMSLDGVSVGFKDADVMAPGGSWHTTKALQVEGAGSQHGLLEHRFVESAKIRAKYLASFR